MKLAIPQKLLKGDVGELLKVFLYLTNKQFYYFYCVSLLNVGVFVVRIRENLASYFSFAAVHDDLTVAN